MEPSGLEIRKRKRSHPDQQPHRRQLNSGEAAAGNSSGSSEDGTSKPARPPLDEEVEEFFAILRRMHDAVKYFGKSGHGNKNSRWTALETGLPVLNGGAGQVIKRVEQKEGRQAAENGVSFDLNVVPSEAEEANGDCGWSGSRAF